MEENKKISFLIPCYGSEKTVGIVIKEIDETVSKNDKYDYEIIMDHKKCRLIFTHIFFRE